MGPPADHDASASHREVVESLLPQPRSFRALDGLFRLADRIVVRPENSLEPPERAAVARFRDRCAAQTGVHLDTSGPATGRPGREIVLAVAAEREPADTFRKSARAAQGYRLRITPERVELVGRSPAGLSYGLQSLGQIVRCCGRDWPCLEIDDEPDFALRGLSYDVSRGKVPTLDTLKELADRLASLKANHLQLYIEHTFAFRFNPNIGRDCSPLTADEIRALDAYCAERRIDVVPALASFGHMGFVLSLPEYRHLAEVETTKSWWELGWTERMHGLTLDVTNPESRELLEKMYDEFLPLFSSELMNVCCDETYDLGKGKNRRRAEELGLGALYLEHLDFLDRLCRRHNKRLMFWGDIIKKYPDLIGRIPQGTVVLNWGYAPDADYDSTALFTDAGLTTIVCPGTAGWNHVVNDLNAAELNIRRYAAAGKKYGAAGLLNTDWGDEGHVNLLAGAWHPIALGAAMAWNSAAPAPETFDRAFGKLFLDDTDGGIVAALRRVAAATDLPRNWPEFCKPLSETIRREALTDEDLANWRSLTTSIAEQLAQVRAGEHADQRDVRELTVACQLAALLGERFEISRELAACAGKPDPALIHRLIRFAHSCDQIVPEYESVWLTRNKRSCLHEVTRVFQRHSAAARELAGKRNDP
jgi:hypothetical protein